MAAVVSQGWSGGSGGGGHNPGGSGGGADGPTHWRCPYFNRPNKHGRLCILQKNKKIHEGREEDVECHYCLDDHCSS
ncbi:hypothetical protein DAPPUDRAFT_328446 [Daphnia pulex]|uniref:Uncharacterized protein n=1 Tax=Daphnia pulex TaxID=6669 RepID=E9HDQ2_DAPPU|nr:hypothetical protein DAPPUDRAFT_328446 [Daphnia pulex]|eukprot:EFX70135.1 hypothetical protein DAPPUDRAFT_328446 [Daphnia pulex]